MQSAGAAGRRRLGAHRPGRRPGRPGALHLEARGLPKPRIQLECESFSTLLALMPSLDVVGIMPLGFFDRYGPRTDLVQLPIEDELPRTTIHILSRADGPLTLPAQRLLDAFVQEASGLRTKPLNR